MGRASHHQIPYYLGWTPYYFLPKLVPNTFSRARSQWLVAAASKNFHPSAVHFAAVLRLVHDIAAVRLRDAAATTAAVDAWAAAAGAGGDAPPEHPTLADAPYPSAEGGGGGGWGGGESLEPAPTSPSFSSASASPSFSSLLSSLRCPAEAGLVRSLLLRACFGGTGGDVAMLRAAASAWAARFAADGERARAATAAEQSVAGCSGDALSSDARLRRLSPPAPHASWSAALAAAWECVGTPPHVLAAAAASSPLAAAEARAMAELAAVPRLCLRDVPLPSIDHHCSHIVDDMLADRAFDAPCRASFASIGGGAPLDTVLSNAMWLFSSSVSNKGWLVEEDGRAMTDAEEGAPEYKAMWDAWRGVEDLAASHARRILAGRFFVDRSNDAHAGRRGDGN